MAYLGFLGPFFQSLSEGRAAATTVFRAIDEVKLNKLLSQISNNLFSFLNIGTRCGEE